MKQEKKQKQVQPTSKKIKESLSYSVEVRDKEGQVLQRISTPSRSYVQQWNQLLNFQARQAGYVVKCTDGSTTSYGPHAGTLNANALAGVTDWGIRVGKGTTAVAITDYALETPLEEGTGLDQLEHQLTQWTVPSVAGSTCSFTVKRVIINNSGATINGIKEIGCYVELGSGVGRYLMGFRDVLPSAVYVPHGGSITVTYTIKVTV